MPDKPYIPAEHVCEALAQIQKNLRRASLAYADGRSNRFDVHLAVALNQTRFVQFCVDNPPRPPDDDPFDLAAPTDPLINTTKPPIVCLSGSTRFLDAFRDAAWHFTLSGYIVLSIAVTQHTATHHADYPLGDHVVAKLDALHLRKIDLADSLHVLNVGGYIGESTRRGIRYANHHAKTITYLEPGPSGDSQP